MELMVTQLDRESYFRRLGEDLEPGGREPAPPPLRVVQKFVNTFNHELGAERDRLGTTAAAGDWLIRNSLLGAGHRISDDDLGRLHRFRETIRALAGRSRCSRLPPPDDVGDVQLRVRVADDFTLCLEPSGDGMDRVVGSILAIVHEAMIDGSWLRLKPCRECSWLFFDHSRNRSGDWCSMAVCGNRHKNQAYRRRNATR
jgi:hypothetical protein